MSVVKRTWGPTTGSAQPRKSLGIFHHLKEGGPLGSEAWLVLVTEDPVGQWELDLGIVELLGHWLVAFAGCDLLHFDDLD